MFITLDQGTTSARTFIFDDLGHIVYSSKKPVHIQTPRSGWVEQDPYELLHAQLETLNESIENTKNKGSFTGLGITSQRETTIIWDKATGEPIYPAIVWQDRRTQPWCTSFSQEKLNRIQDITGLKMDPYFSASKIKWILDHVKGAYQRAQKGELAFGTVDSWLIWHLTGGLHVTDITNASRTMLMNINRHAWCEELFSLFDIPASLFPKIVASSGVIAHTLPEKTGGLSMPIYAVLGDQQASLFGHGCIHSGDAKCTYGTGCFLLMNTNQTIHTQAKNLLNTVAWQLEDQPVQYALEGSVFMAGAIIQWLKDQLGIIQHISDIEPLAKSVRNNGGVTMVPAFTGLGSPYWRSDISASIQGLNRGTNKAHIARAALESIAFQVYDVFKYMQTQTPLSVLKVDGGVSNNAMLMQFQADLLGVPVLKSKNTDTTALGVAQMMALSAKTHTIDDLKSWWVLDRAFEPKMFDDQRKSYLDQWHKAIQVML